MAGKTSFIHHASHKISVMLVIVIRQNVAAWTKVLSHRQGILTLGRGILENKISWGLFSA